MQMFKKYSASPCCCSYNKTTPTYWSYESIKRDKHILVLCSEHYHNMVPSRIKKKIPQHFSAQKVDKEKNWSERWSPDKIQYSALSRLSSAIKEAQAKYENVKCIIAQNIRGKRSIPTAMVDDPVMFVFVHCLLYSQTGMSARKKKKTKLWEPKFSTHKYFVRQ